MITEKDIEHINDTWEHIMHDELQNMLKFYNRLFEIAPEVRIYFPDDMSKLAEKLSYTLNLLVTNLHDFENLKPALEDLGRKHREMGVLSNHYTYVVNSLLYTVKEVMDVYYHEDMGKAWKKVLVAVSTIMINAPEKKENKFSAILKKLFG